MGPRFNAMMAQRTGAPVIRVALPAPCRAFSLCLALALASCRSAGDGGASVPLRHWEPASFGDLKGWKEDDHAAALVAFRRSCARIVRVRPDTPLGGGVKARALRPACQGATAVQGKAQAQAFFERFFRPATHKDGKEARLTAYFEPVIAASRHRSFSYHWPIYARPEEIESENGAWGVRRWTGALAPAWTRQEIDAGALEGRGLEIAWARDPVDAYILHIQGSGRLAFPDGTGLRVGFAAKNGHPYRSVGRIGKEQGLLRNGAGAKAIRRLFAENPGAGRRLLQENESYVFFRRLATPSHLHPPGALGASLSPMRSLALDRRFAPLGIPVWVDAELENRRLRQLMVAQDTGAAVRGAGRADIYFGSGAAAGRAAARVNHRGRMLALLPRTLLAPDG